MQHDSNMYQQKEEGKVINSVKSDKVISLSNDGGAPIEPTKKNVTFSKRLNCDSIMLVAIVILTCVLTAESQPNIVLFLTDDQDAVLHGMFPLRQTQRLIGEAGVTFTNAFTTSPLCCPSRATVLSGKYAHNHKTYNNSFSGGCCGQHWLQDIEPKALPVMLQNAGYETFFAGKYLNQYHGAHLPAGWNDFHGLHGNSRYYNYKLRENAKNNSYSDTYLTDLLKDLTLDFLKARLEAKSTRPFFAMIAPPAPHQPFTPAPRHQNAFAGIKALRTPNFNMQAQPLDKHWLVSSSHTMEPAIIELVDQYFQKRWETLLAVDELVSAVVEHLVSTNELDRTYVLFTSDNGYHLGQFAQPYDKRQPYETDIRVPLLVRGPSVLVDKKLDTPIALIDLMPTMLEWAGITMPENLDGTSFAKELSSNVFPTKELHRSLLIQHWGEGNAETYNADCPERVDDNLTGCTLESDCHCQDAKNNTYACVRHFRGDVDRLYCEFHDDEDFVEAYDVVDDPYQMQNLGYELLPIERAFYNLALENLTHCEGDSCKNVNI